MVARGLRKIPKGWALWKQGACVPFPMSLPCPMREKPRIFDPPAPCRRIWRQGQSPREPLTHSGLHAIGLLRLWISTGPGTTLRKGSKSRKAPLRALRKYACLACTKKASFTLPCRDCACAFLPNTRTRETDRPESPDGTSLPQPQTRSGFSRTRRLACSFGTPLCQRLTKGARTYKKSLSATKGSTVQETTFIHSWP